MKAWSVPADATAGPITVDGASVTVTTTSPGQNAQATFTGVSGQKIQVQTSGSTFASTVSWSIVRPNGTTLVSSSGDRTLASTTLPEGGTYTFKLDPVDTTTGSMTVKVYTATP